MKLIFGLLAVVIQAKWIGGEWKTMCYKSSCRLGRAHCCTPKIPPTTTIEPEVWPTDEAEAVTMPVPDLPNTKPVPLPDIAVMPSFPDVDDVEEAVDVTKREVVVHLKDGDISLDLPVRSRSLFGVFSKGYFEQLAEQAQNFDWSKLPSKIVNRLPTIVRGPAKENDENSTKIVRKFAPAVMQRFVNQALGSFNISKNRLRANLMETLLSKLNTIFGAGWDEIEDLAALGGEEIAQLVKSLKEELHAAVQMVLDYLNFDDGFSVDTLKGDIIKLLIENLEQITDPDQVKPIRDVIKDAKKEFVAIMNDAIDRTMEALFDEVNALLDHIQADDGFTVETPKDQLLVDLLKSIQSVVDPDGDMKPKDLIKMIKKSFKKFAKSWGKMELMEKIELIVEKLSESDTPLDQAYRFFLENLNEVLSGNKDFDDVVHDVRMELLELALETVERLEEQLADLLGDIFNV